MTVKAGQAFVDAAEVTHRVFRNLDASRGLRFVIAYTIRAEDEPLRVLPTACPADKPCGAPTSASRSGRAAVGMLRESP